MKKPLFEYMFKIFKKLVSVLAISIPLIEATKKDNIVLEKISYIHYPILFKIDKVRALINSGNKINIMTPAYALKLG